MCSKCGKKKAVLRKPFTNLSLCLECYMSDLHKRLKRNLSRSKQLEYRGKVAYLLPSRFVATALLGLDILLSIEKKYSGDTYVMLDDCGVAELLRPRVKEFARFFYIPELEILTSGEIGLKEKSLVGWWRKYRSVAASASLKLGFKSLIVAMCAEATSKMEVSSLLSSKIDGGGEGGLLLTRPDGFSFINIFYGITCREISLISYLLYPDLYELQLKKGREFVESTTDRYASNLIFSAIKWRSGEVIYSIDKSLRWLFEFSSITRCRYCGGIAIEGDTCSYCRVFSSPPWDRILSQAEAVECPKKS